MPRKTSSFFHLKPLIRALERMGWILRKPQRCLHAVMFLTHFSPVPHFYTPWKRQKTFVFWRFQGIQKCDTGLKWVKGTANSRGKTLNQALFSTRIPLWRPWNKRNKPQREFYIFWGTKIWEKTLNPGLLIHLFFTSESLYEGFGTNEVNVMKTCKTIFWGTTNLREKKIQIQSFFPTYTINVNLGTNGEYSMRILYLYPLKT